MAGLIAMSLLSPSSALLLLATFFVVWTAQSWYRLRSVPGPWWNALSFTAFVATVWRGNSHVDIGELAKRYGDLVRIGPNEVVTSDVDVSRRMAGPKSSYSRSEWYGTMRLDPSADHVFSIRDETRHRDRRARVSPAYTTPVLEFEASVSAQLERLVRLIDSKYISTDTTYRPVDFARLTHFFSLEVIGDITFGAPFGYLNEGTDVFGYLQWNRGSVKRMMTMSTIPGITKVLYRPPMAWFAPKATDRTGLGRFIGLAKEVVESHQAAAAAGETRKDMMGLLISKGLKTEELVSEAVLQVVAGTESVATTMRMTLLYIVVTPVVWSKLRTELDAAIASGKVSSPIRDDEARQLPYLQATVREGMRLFPGTTPPFSKVVPEGGDTVAGHALPAGTRVGVNVFGMLRSKTYWGEDADLFRPERWLEADEKSLDRMNTVLEVQFGFGRYKCLGKPIALLEMNKFLPELLRRYDIAVVNPASPLKIVNAGFWLMSDMWLRITHRMSDDATSLKRDI